MILCIHILCHQTFVYLSNLFRDADVKGENLAKGFDKLEGRIRKTKVRSRQKGKHVCFVVGSNLKPTKTHDHIHRSDIK